MNCYKKKFDIIFLRWCIGFVENIFELIDELKEITTPNGYVYISYSPPSLAILVRWMFDDYTYLRLYNKDFLIELFKFYGFNLISEYNEGSYKWDKDLHIIQKIFSSLLGGYKYLKRATEEEKLQHNISLLFKKNVKN